MSKLKSVKTTEPPPVLEAKPKEADIPYHVVSSMRLGELIVQVNHWILTKEYKPIGGAQFSDQMGLWTQTLIK